MRSTEYEITRNLASAKREETIIKILNDCTADDVDAIIKAAKRNPRVAYYALVDAERLMLQEEMEILLNIVAQDAQLSYMWACYAEDRFHAGEQAILSNPHYAVQYAMLLYRLNYRVLTTAEALRCIGSNEAYIVTVDQHGNVSIGVVSQSMEGQR